MAVTSREQLKQYCLRNLGAPVLEKILPWLVDETDGVKSVNYSGLIGYLIQSNKEMQKRIEALESK